MKMGSLATIGANAPENLVHIVLDNATYDSTGGQPTVSTGVDFARVAAACGYRQGFTCDTPAGFEESLATAVATPGPHLIHMKIAPGSAKNLGRPTVEPRQVARRFKNFIVSA
jgi:phosphonopyruvate decarboxylase